MEKPEIVAHTSRFSSIFLTVMTTLLLLTIRTQLENKPLNWEMFNLARAGGGVFALVFALWVLLVLTYFDRAPQLVVNNDGIAKRKYYWPFVNKYLNIPWHSMYYYFFVTNGRLIIQQKEKGKEIKIWLTALDIPPADILAAIKKYAALNSVKDLGVEPPPSRLR